MKKLSIQIMDDIGPVVYYGDGDSNDNKVETLVAAIVSGEN